MPRSWHSSTSYFSFRPTVLPQMSQTSPWAWFALPHRWQITSWSPYGSAMSMLLHWLHGLRRWCSPWSLLHLHSQSPRPPAPWSPVVAEGRASAELLDFDLGADVLELLLDCRGLFLGDAFLDRLGRSLDEVLGFLETQGGDLADDLDDVDLVAADFGQRDGELGLLLGRRRRRGAAALRHRHRHRGGHAELRFERLHELRELQDADSLDVLDHPLLRHFGHCLLLPHM